METSLVVSPQALARAEVMDPLAAILAGQLSEHTRRAYRHDLGHLLAFLQQGPGLDWGALGTEAKHALIQQAFADPEALARLLAVSRAELIAFRTHLKQAGLATLAVNRRLTGVGSLLREVQLQGYRPDNPAARLRTLRTNRDWSPTIGLSAEQARALLDAPAGDELPSRRDRALLALLLRNGLRAAEVVGLRVGDLGEDEGFRVAAIGARAASCARRSWRERPGRRCRPGVVRCGDGTAGPKRPCSRPCARRGKMARPRGR